MSFELVRGTRDILPDEASRWQRIEEAFREVARRYNYREIRFPILEQTELFTRGIGETTEVVNKQMYTFPDRKGRSLTLRPEGTASAARVYLNAGLHVNDPFQKWYYVGPMFRYEKPQKGRYRQFDQYGVEVFGSLDPSVDAEVIAFAWALMSELGLEGLRLKLNSIGCPEDRARFQEVLREHFAESIASMCPDCQRRHTENPLRILDCKESGCQPFIEKAPGSVDHLCSDCTDHFAEVQTLLDRLTLPFEIDPRLVRGLDYYTRTVFELISDDLGAQDSLLGGGRYDGLIETLGGPATPGIGFAGGTDRLALVLREQHYRSGEDDRIDLFLAALGEEAHREAMMAAFSLRQEGLSVEFDHRHRSLKKQLTMANKLGSCFLIVFGDDEVDSRQVWIKDLDTGDGRESALIMKPLARMLKEMLRKKEEDGSEARRH
ncbi:MAG: histidine--tRNA ligase [Candidatus Bipolaricaulia bacterium]